MFPNDFKKYDIKHFTLEEILQTGAELSGIDPELIVRIDKLRKLLNRPIHPLSNGINSGDHRSREHRRGEALDFCVRGKFVTPKQVLYKAIEASFRGIGVYYNKQTGIYSYHVDLGKIRMWTGFKKTRADKWTYLNFFKDPKTYVKK